MDKADLKQLKKLKFWGAAVSAHQVEGGNHNQWTVWELEHAKELARGAKHRHGHLPIWKDVAEAASDPANYVSDRAIEHFSRFRQDFDLVEELGFNAWRFSIEWSRIEPEEGQFDEAAIAYYRGYLKELQRRGIEPFVNFWHWTMPVWFTDKGGFLKYRNIRYFIRFVDKLMEELDVKLNYVTVLNEPTVYASFSYNNGQWPPQEHSLIKFTRVVYNLAVAHRRAYKVIKRHDPNISVGSVNLCVYNDSEPDMVSRFSARFTTYVWDEVFLDLIKRTSDFIGLNYYFSSRFKGFRKAELDAPRSDLGWSMEPAKIQFLLARLHKRYQKPIIVTENGVADMHDRYRKWWLEEILKGIAAAQARGVDVFGYLHWSMFDNFEWSEGRWPRFGLVAIDYETMKRTIRPSGRWFARLIHDLKKS